MIFYSCASSGGCGGPAANFLDGSVAIDFMFLAIGIYFLSKAAGNIFTLYRHHMLGYKE